MIHKWEYRVVDIYSPEDLDHAGDEGWELVSVVAMENWRNQAYFKRPRAKAKPDGPSEEVFRLLKERIRDTAW